jgi:hypothetical protein
MSPIKILRQLETKGSNVELREGVAHHGCPIIGLIYLGTRFVDRMNNVVGSCMWKAQEDNMVKQINDIIK